MNFELRFWTYREAWFQLKSEVAVGVVKALGVAGIQIPFPQRDLHIRSIGLQVIKAETAEDLLTDSSTGADRAENGKLTPPQAAEREKKSQEALH